MARRARKASTASEAASIATRKRRHDKAGGTGGQGVEGTRESTISISSSTENEARLPERESSASPPPARKKRRRKEIASSEGDELGRDESSRRSEAGPHSSEAGPARGKGKSTEKRGRKKAAPVRPERADAVARGRDWLSRYGLRVAAEDWTDMWRNKTLMMMRLHEHEEMLKAFIEQGGTEAWTSKQEARDWAQLFFFDDLDEHGNLPPIEEKIRMSKRGARLRKQAEREARGVTGQSEDETEDSDEGSGAPARKRYTKKGRDVEEEDSAAPFLRGKQKIPDYDAVAISWWKMCQDKERYLNKHELLNAPLGTLCLFEVDKDIKVQSSWKPAMQDAYEFDTQNHRHKMIIRGGKVLQDDAARLVGNTSCYLVRSDGHLYRKEPNTDDSYTLLTNGLNLEGDANIEFVSKLGKGVTDACVRDGKKTKVKVWYIPEDKPIPEEVRGTYVLWICEDTSKKDKRDPSARTFAKRGRKKNP